MCSVGILFYLTNFYQMPVIINDLGGIKEFVVVYFKVSHHNLNRGTEQNTKNQTSQSAGPFSNKEC
jgi:hypothetical protein